MPSVTTLNRPNGWSRKGEFTVGNAQAIKQRNHVSSFLYSQRRQCSKDNEVALAKSMEDDV